MPIHSSAAEILSRYPGPVTFYPSRKKWLLVFAICMLIVVTSPGMIRAGHWMGWVGLILSGACTLIAGTVMLLPGALRMTLDHEGFEVRKLFRRSRRRWRDVSRFDVWTVQPLYPKIVVYDDAEQKSTMRARANIAVCGHTSGLPDTYGFSADALTHLITQWRERALGRNVPR